MEWLYKDEHVKMSTSRRTLPPTPLPTHAISLDLSPLPSFVTGFRLFFRDFSFVSTFLTCVMTCFYYQELSRKAINTPLPCSTHVLWRRALFIMTKTRRVILHPHLLLPLSNDFVILEETIHTDTNIQPMLYLLFIRPYTIRHTRNFLRLQLAEPHTPYTFRYKYRHAQLWDGLTKDNTVWEIWRGGWWWWGGGVQTVPTG